MNQQETEAQALIDEEKITAYKIEQETGVSASTISKLRNEKRDTSKLTSDTQARLADYWDSLQHPFLHFWESDDMKIFEHWLKTSTQDNWRNTIHKTETFDYRKVPVYTDYVLRVSLSPVDDLTEDLFKKYLDKYDKLVKAYPSDKPFLNSIQPFYVHLNRYSYFGEPQLSLFADKVRETFGENIIPYAKEFLDGYCDSEIVSARSLSVEGLLSKDDPELRLQRGIQISVSPLPHLMSSAPYNS